MEKNMSNKEILEEAIKYYAHNNFDMHETNNYKALAKGFEAGAKWQQEEIYNQIKELYDNEHITGFSKRAYSQCLDIVEQFKNK